jgi:hypothetical protein
MSLVPNFRHFRLLNIISLVGTAYTAVYLIATAGVPFVMPALLMDGHRKGLNACLERLDYFLQHVHGCSCKVEQIVR